MYFDDFKVSLTFHVHGIKEFDFQTIPKCNSIEFIVNSNAVFETCGKEFVLNSPVIFWTRKGCWYRLKHNALDGYFEHFCLDMDGERAERIVQSLEKTFPTHFMHPENPALVRTIFSDMLHIFRTGEKYKHHEFVLLVEKLMCAIKESSIRRDIPEDPYRITRLAASIREKPFQKLNLKQYCTEQGLSLDYLRRLFKKRFGVTLLEYIHDHQMLYASLLLQSGKYRIKEVAVMCGFAELSVFSRAFKHYSGIPPSRLCRK